MILLPRSLVIPAAVTGVAAAALGTAMAAGSRLVVGRVAVNVADREAPMLVTLTMYIGMAVGRVGDFSSPYRPTAHLVSAVLVIEAVGHHEPW